MMNQHTGRHMPLIDHIGQSIRNILFTRIGTRVQREEYGSALPMLIDMPLTEAVLMRCNMAVAVALARWEPRFVLQSVRTQPEAGSKVVITLTGKIGGTVEQFIVRI